MDAISTAVLILTVRTVVKSIVRAVVPIVLGLIAACIAGAFYAVFLNDGEVDGFFASAAGVATAYCWR